jgi:hypothetical protein
MATTVRSGSWTLVAEPGQSRWRSSILAAQAPFAGDISVRGIDRSRAMRRLGKKLWAAFLAEAMESGLDRLSEAIDGMSGSCSASDYPALVSSSDRLEKESVGGLSWLTAVHAVYEGNWSDFERLYYNVHDRVKPCCELVTSRTKEDLLKDLVSQPRGGRLVAGRAAPCWHGEAAKTTEWRRALADALGSSCGLTPKYLRYLRSAVGWNKKPVGAWPKSWAAARTASRWAETKMSFASRRAVSKPASDLRGHRRSNAAIARDDRCSRTDLRKSGGSTSATLSRTAVAWPCRT